MSKICSKCDIRKPLSEFTPRKDSKDGYKGYCRECANKRDAGKQSTPAAKAYKAAHYKANKSKYKERAKINREKDPVAHAAKKKIYREENAEKVAAGKKRCIEKNPEKYQMKKKEDYQNNKEQIKARSKERYNGPKRDEIIAKQKAYAEAHPEQTKAIKKAFSERQKTLANKALKGQLEEVNAKLFILGADEIPDKITGGLVYIAYNSGRPDLNKVGFSSAERGLLRFQELNDPKSRKTHMHYGELDGCSDDWTPHIVLIIQGHDKPHHVEQMLHFALAEYNILGKSGERELFKCSLLHIENVIQNELGHLLQQ